MGLDALTQTCLRDSRLKLLQAAARAVLNPELSRNWEELTGLSVCGLSSVNIDQGITSVFWQGSISRAQKAGSCQCSLDLLRKDSNLL